MIVCEGEKSADAAARVFPNSVCITSPNGSQSASKADWTPIARLGVLIWPDADEPGSKYAGAVARILHELGWGASIIDATALANLPPSKFKEGWDAADAIAEWQDLVALRRAAHGLAKPFEPGAHEGQDALPPKAKAKGNSHDKQEATGEGVTLDDFNAYMPTHSYNFAPSREMWPRGFHRSPTMEQN